MAALSPHAVVRTVVHTVVQLQPETTLTADQKAALRTAIERAAADYTAAHLQRASHLESQDTYRMPWPEGVAPAIVDHAYFAEPATGLIIEFRAKQQRAECAVYVALENATTGLRTSEVCMHVLASEHVTQVNYWPKHMSQPTLDVLLWALIEGVATQGDARP